MIAALKMVHSASDTDDPATMSQISAAFFHYFSAKQTQKQFTGLVIESKTLCKINHVDIEREREKIKHVTCLMGVLFYILLSV